MMISMLYSEMYEQLYVLDRAKLTDLTLVEDAVQDTFKTACIKVNDLETAENPKGWLVNALSYIVINTNRKQRKHNSFSTEPFDDNTMGSTDDSHNIELIYGELVNKEQFFLIKRSAIEQNSVEDISRELGISLEACKKRVQRARNKIRNKIEENDLF